MQSRTHIAVIGAGAFGGWSALYLLRRNARVTLIDVSLDRLLDDAVMARLQQAKTEDDAKAALANVPGVKVNFDQELTIEFMPSF